MTALIGTFVILTVPFNQFLESNYWSCDYHNEQNSLYILSLIKLIQATQTHASFSKRMQDCVHLTCGWDAANPGAISDETSCLFWIGSFRSTACIDTPVQCEWKGTTPRWDHLNCRNCSGHVIYC